MGSDVDAVLSIAARWQEGDRAVRDLFGQVVTIPVDVEQLRSELEAALAEHDPRIEAWQQYSYDKRGSPSPYLDGPEVGFYDAGYRHVVRHKTTAAACADFVSREAAWVLERRVVEA